MSVLDTCTVPFAPVYDTHVDLVRLRGITAALASLTGPDHLREDDALGVLHETLQEISDRLDCACETLSAAIGETKTAKEEMS